MRFVVVASASLVGVVATTTGFAQVAPSEFDSSANEFDSSANLFRERVAAYMQLRQAVVADLLETGLDPDADGGRWFRQTVAEALQQARRQSQRGDIFCPEVADRLRQMVWDTVSSRPPRDQQEMLSEVPQVSRVL